MYLYLLSIQLLVSVEGFWMLCWCTRTIIRPSSAFLKHKFSRCTSLIEPLTEWWEAHELARLARDWWRLYQIYVACQCHRMVWTYDTRHSFPFHQDWEHSAWSSHNNLQANHQHSSMFLHRLALFGRLLNRSKGMGILQFHLMLKAKIRWSMSHFNSKVK